MCLDILWITEKKIPFFTILTLTFLLLAFFFFFGSLCQFHHSVAFNHIWSNCFELFFFIFFLVVFFLFKKKERGGEGGILKKRFFFSFILLLYILHHVLFVNMWAACITYNKMKKKFQRCDVFDMCTSGVRLCNGPLFFFHYPHSIDEFGLNIHTIHTYMQTETFFGFSEKLLGA